jgi:hypothetical protein
MSVTIALETRPIGATWASSSAQPGGPRDPPINSKVPDRSQQIRESGVHPTLGPLARVWSQMPVLDEARRRPRGSSIPRVVSVTDHVCWSKENDDRIPHEPTGSTWLPPEGPPRTAVRPHSISGSRHTSARPRCRRVPGRFPHRVDVSRRAPRAPSSRESLDLSGPVAPEGPR